KVSSTIKWIKCEPHRVGEVEHDIVGRGAPAIAERRGKGPWTGVPRSHRLKAHHAERRYESAPPIPGVLLAIRLACRWSAAQETPSRILEPPGLRHRQRRCTILAVTP